jgi:hypothetical protein
MYEHVLRFEQTLGVNFEWVLQVGDFGVWPDPAFSDPATERHGGVGDFHRWLKARRPVPRRTAFIKGNHEDHVWLDKNAREGEILPGLTYIPNGTRIDLITNGQHLAVGGLGGSFSARDYVRPSAQLQGRAKRHYTRDEVDSLMRCGGLDVLLVHEAPAGAYIQKDGFGYESDVDGISDLLVALRPRVCFSGHHRAPVTCEVAGVP